MYITVFAALTIFTQRVLLGGEISWKSFLFWVASSGQNISSRNLNIDGVW
jgi:hypothetical protein